MKINKFMNNSGKGVNRNMMKMTWILNQFSYTQITSASVSTFHPLELVSTLSPYSYTNTNKEKFGSFFSHALAYEVNGFPR